MKEERKAKERVEKLTKSNQQNNNSKNINNNQQKEPKFFELKEGVEYFKSSSKSNGARTTNDIIKNEKLKKLPLLNRLQYSSSQNDRNKNNNNNKNDDTLVFRSDSYGNKQMTFMSNKARREKDNEKRAKEHHLERKNIRRSAGKITKTFKKPQFLKKR